MGLVNEVVPVDKLDARAREVASELIARSPLALGALKVAFSARHNGVSGQARMAHDQQLTLYLTTHEAQETSRAFSERRVPDASLFWT
jgi:naphthoate synthase